MSGNRSHSWRRHWSILLLLLLVAGWGAIALSAKDEPKPKEATPRGGESESKKPPSGKRSASPPLKDLRLQSEEESAEERIEQSLSETVSVNFGELALARVLDQLKSQHKLPLWIDRRGLDDAAVSLDQPVTLVLENVHLETVLNLLLEPLQLEWVVQDEVLKITTLQRAALGAETRTYEIQNLIDAGHTPEELIEAIEKCLAPDSWGDKAHQGAIRHSGGILICRQSQRVQSLVAGLLMELDLLAEKQEFETFRDGSEGPVTLKVYHTRQFPADQLARELPQLVAIDSWKNEEVNVRAIQGALLIRQTPRVHAELRRFLEHLFEGDS
ncbi:MAG: hypothetical protein ACKV0T_28840 [Planctomycetales bacterium]